MRGAAILQRDNDEKMIHNLFAERGKLRMHTIHTIKHIFSFIINKSTLNEYCIRFTQKHPCTRSDTQYLPSELETRDVAVLHAEHHREKRMQIPLCIQPLQMGEKKKRCVSTTKML